jgi:hypothetical protein
MTLSPRSSIYANQNEEQIPGRFSSPWREKPKPATGGNFWRLKVETLGFCMPDV